MKGNNNLTHNLSRDSLSDTFFTPPDAVLALLRHEAFEGMGWEPASGSGNISKCFDPPLFSTDLSTAEWVYGGPGIDFLTHRRDVDFIITNPPYKLAVEFAEHALECAPKVALFLRVQFLESNKRLAFFRANPPRHMYVFTGRVRCYSPSYEGSQSGLSSQTLAWFVWERGFAGEPTIRWLEYP